MGDKSLVAERGIVGILTPAHQEGGEAQAKQQKCIAFHNFTDVSKGLFDDRIHDADGLAQVRIHGTTKRVLKLYSAAAVVFTHQLLKSLRTAVVRLSVLTLTRLQQSTDYMVKESQLHQL